VLKTRRQGSPSGCGRKRTPAAPKALLERMGLQPGERSHSPSTRRTFRLRKHAWQRKTVHRAVGGVVSSSSASGAPAAARPRSQWRHEADLLRRALNSGWRAAGAPHLAVQRSPRPTTSPA